MIWDSNLPPWIKYAVSDPENYDGFFDSIKPRTYGSGTVLNCNDTCVSHSLLFEDLHAAFGQAGRTTMFRILIRSISIWPMLVSHTKILGSLWPFKARWLGVSQDFLAMCILSATFGGTFIL